MNRVSWGLRDVIWKLGGSEHGVREAGQKGRGRKGEVVGKGGRVSWRW